MLRIGQLHMQRAARADNVQPKWGAHSAHGIGHGLYPLLGLVPSLELCISGAPRFLELQGTTNLRGESLMPHYGFAYLCMGGVLHTALNCFYVPRLRQLARAGVNSTRQAVCAEVWPLPNGYAGPLLGIRCPEVIIGAREADARLELVRRGGCAEDASPHRWADVRG